MLLALAEAEKGQGRTSPNPCVGAVIVKDGQICGRGYHHKAGTPHAEIHALRDAASRACGATMYVTLEPCCHTGRTGPCSHAIVEAGISHVVVGMGDPNPRVNGGGITYLREHGVSVTCFVQEDRCRALNRPFLKYIATGLPYITLKAAVSLDGRLSCQKGKTAQITGQESLQRVHELRDCYDGILVGKNTVLVDDPALTTRLPDKHGRKRRDAIRIVLDSYLKTSPEARIYHLDSEAPTWVFCLQECSPDHVERWRLATKNTEVFQVPRNDQGKVDLHAVCKIIAEKGCLSLLVEGGGTIHGAFLQEQLADSVGIFSAPLIFGDLGTPFVSGLSTVNSEQAIQVVSPKITQLGSDLLVEGLIEYLG